MDFTKRYRNLRATCRVLVRIRNNDGFKSFVATQKMPRKTEGCKISFLFRRDNFADGSSRRDGGKTFNELFGYLFHLFSLHPDNVRVLRATCFRV